MEWDSVLELLHVYVKWVSLISLLILNPVIFHSMASDSSVRVPWGEMRRRWPCWRYGGAPFLPNRIICGRFGGRCRNLNNIVETVRARYPIPEVGACFVRSFFRQFLPRDNITSEAIQTLVHAILAGYECHRISRQIPPSLTKRIEAWEREVVGVANKFSMFTVWDILEVFNFHHGLRYAPESVKKYLKTRSALDVGAFEGDSAVILADYAKDVFPFELTPTNTRVMREKMKAYPQLMGNVHDPINVGISDHEGTMTITDRSSPGMSMVGTSLAPLGGTIVNLTTIDKFVVENNVTVGIIKCDVEGAGLGVVRGALETIKRDRPILALSVYHSGEEMFDIPLLLLREVHNYHFSWELENYPHLQQGQMYETVFLGFPNEILSSSEREHLEGGRHPPAISLE